MNEQQRNYQESGLVRPRNFIGSILHCGLLALACSSLSLPAATLRWVGAAANGNWSRGPNWDLGTAPVAGDTLVFPGGQPRLANNNDITGLQVATIRFTGPSAGYVLSGNAIAVTDGIDANQIAGNNSVQSGARYPAGQWNVCGGEKWRFTAD